MLISSPHLTLCTFLLSVATTTARTTEFGFSANKKKLVLPVVEFLCKLHVSRERDVVRRRMGKNSKWHSLRTNATVKFNLEEAVLHNKRTAVSLLVVSSFCGAFFVLSKSIVL
ncbi:hypothetical protein ElyMa_005147200 [Elysia marginata]|uniref:Uncharacterized protein n=1 Tax=Elysia marginata TaxID=1093978 RepID=A0AAV4JRL4_9GAST|nr:hypothetical protein ElyMa_005147200 [Elysia marginata]